MLIQHLASKDTVQEWTIFRNLRWKAVSDEHYLRNGRLYILFSSCFSEFQKSSAYQIQTRENVPLTIFVWGWKLFCVFWLSNYSLMHGLCLPFALLTNTILKWLVPVMWLWRYPLWLQALICIQCWSQAGGWRRCWLDKKLSRRFIEKGPFTSSQKAHCSECVQCW